MSKRMIALAIVVLSALSLMAADSTESRRDGSTVAGISFPPS